MLECFNTANEVCKFNFEQVKLCKISKKNLFQLSNWLYLTKLSVLIIQDSQS